MPLRTLSALILLRRAAQELPTSFDVVVVGTGLTESLVAAAATRAGKSVLHLDANSFYGSRNATFNLKTFDRWLRCEADEDDFRAAAAATPAAEPLAEAATGARVLPVERVLDWPEQVSYVAEASPAPELLEQSHRYNVDLTPQLLLSAGLMVDVLRSSGVANYLEFKPLQAYLYNDGALATGAAHSVWRRVPCGKADIFQSGSIPLIQKRQLMKFLQSCVALQPALEPKVHLRRQALASPDAPPVPVAEAEGTFLDFAATQRLSPALADLALYAILQHPASTLDGSVPPPPAADGVRSVCRHLRSLGVYGPTAYLVSLYGSSELAQGFCRLCAVWGGVYMLSGRALAVELGPQSDLAVELGPQAGPQSESDAEAAADGGPAAWAAAPAGTAAALGRVPTTALDRVPERVLAVRGSNGRRIACEWLVLNSDSALPATVAASSSGGAGGAAGGAQGASSSTPSATSTPAGTDAVEAEPARTPPPPPPPAIARAVSGVARAVCILDGPVLCVEGRSAEDQIALGILFPQDRIAAGSGAGNSSGCGTGSARDIDSAGGGGGGGGGGGAVVGTSTVFVLQQSSEASVCPTGKVLLHLSAQAIEGVTAEQQLRPVLQMLLAQQAAAAMAAMAAREAAQAAAKSIGGAQAAAPMVRLLTASPNAVTVRVVFAGLVKQGPEDVRVDVLWGAYFHLPTRSCMRAAAEGAVPGATWPANLLACDDLPMGLGSETHVERAQALFRRICPGAPFLPSAEDADQGTEPMDDTAEGHSGPADAEGESSVAPRPSTMVQGKQAGAAPAGEPMNVE